MNEKEHRKRLKRWIDRASLELTTRQYQVAMLHWVDGYKQTEIAKRLGIKPAAVSEHKRKAKEILDRTWDGSL